MTTQTQPCPLSILEHDAPAETDDQPGAVHPAGRKARLLLTSVFGPYAQDDEYGSRAINPMELYHNQVTRVQGAFSLRMFHRSWGLKLIQDNLDCPVSLLDFPSRDRFIEELRTHRYDIIGISAIAPNLEKVAAMCQLIRKHQPEAVIVVGGHIANMPDLADCVDADHIVRGEGVRWMQRFTGQPDDQALRHPRLLSGIGSRALGVTLSEKPGEVAATLIPGVGCPVGCNFCSTSAMFGGKGKFVDFYPTGDALFEVMCGLERDLKVSSFFVMDENFLLHRRRALRLLELMEKHDKAWSLYVFSSANVIKSYTIEQLVRLGISWVWMGLEGRESQYTKLRGTDTRQLVADLQAHGIRILGSSIIGLEEHTEDNLDEAIDYSVSHNTEFHQFMLYTAVAGTPLWHEMNDQGRLKGGRQMPAADIHGQLRFNFKHQHLPAGRETDFLLEAFRRDFEVNGPSILRVARTTLAGWQRYRKHPDRRVRRRYQIEARSLALTLSSAVWAARAWYADNQKLRPMMDSLLADLYQAFPLRARLAAPIGGRYLLRKLRDEDNRLKKGWTYEPPTFYEHNAAASAAIAQAPPARSSAG